MMLAYQVKSRVKIVILFFIVAFILAGIGVYLYFFRNKEPTHGVFVNNQNYPIREEATTYGYLYKTP